MRFKTQQSQFIMITITIVILSAILLTSIIVYFIDQVNASSKDKAKQKIDKAKKKLKGKSGLGNGNGIIITWWRF